MPASRSSRTELAFRALSKCRSRRKYDLRNIGEVRAGNGESQNKANWLASSSVPFLVFIVLQMRAFNHSLSSPAYVVELQLFMVESC